MPPKKISGKAVWAVSISVVIIVGLLMVLYLAQNSDDVQDSIVLPTEQEYAPSDVVIVPEDQDISSNSSFYEVTNENVLLALRSLNRPTSYHQTYVVTVGSDDLRAVHHVDLWINGDLLHAETSNDTETRCLISDGTNAYMWYKGEDIPLSLQLQNGQQIEDLLGLPDFDAYLSLSDQSVVDSDYLVLEDPSVQCIYVCAQDDPGSTSRFWVNLENGLLFQADILELSNQVYSVRQSAFEILAAEDEAFADRFLLPDGNAPFSSASRILQP